MRCYFLWKKKPQENVIIDPTLHFSTNCTDARSGIAPGDMAFVCNPNDPSDQWQCFDYMQTYGQGPDCNYQCDNQMDEGEVLRESFVYVVDCIVNGVL